MPRPSDRNKRPSSRPRRFTADLTRRPLRLRLYPDSMLREICQPVRAFRRDVGGLVRDMLELMHRHAGIGLAAPQVGLLVQAIVADIGEEPVCVINPSLTPTGTIDRMTEGCLSLPGVFVEIEREIAVEVRGLDPAGSPVHFEAKGLMARVLQHEVDHLHGVLICDYAGEYEGGRTPLKGDSDEQTEHAPERREDRVRGQGGSGEEHVSRSPRPSDATARL